MSENKGNPNVLVISAHALDFVWRCGGTIAKYSNAGSNVRIINLTLGERGESGDLWNGIENATEEQVKEIRTDEANKASEILGAELKIMDMGDHPLITDKENIIDLVKELREFQPEIILTHFTGDPLNPDHPEAAKLFYKALRAAQVPGVEPDTKILGPVKTFMFEPDQPEFCGFNPDAFIDITDVMEIKEKAMTVSESQKYMFDNYSRRAAYRGYIASRVSGNKEIKNAEAFKRFAPYTGQFFS
ncbi:hypothetical protein CIL05_00160 [Virgibacillus profundi]|uniref:PIG-L domain-containing protein n=1 Tax=Virgibacillus profundi TaxID=2024555 RepID=A0A2A2IIA8_9BACI|nr:PIG-L deacetylase family protein [Virgibacillus profundi]PAV31108.1 hypothetical protein CIL05_00160 [Virgibacillus profundi]PXY55291.1 PIG-L family deacetylase [Virgibacillus profundi]